MNLQPSLQHAEAYINIHASRSGPDYHGKPPGPFVTISRESGTGVGGGSNRLACPFRCLRKSCSALATIVGVKRP